MDDGDVILTEARRGKGARTQTRTVPEKYKVPNESYVLEMRKMLDWALSSLNKSRDELLDVCFVVYLEFYIRIFKLSAECGCNFLREFSVVFEDKFGHFVDQLVDFKFLEQLANSPVLRVRNPSQKHLVVITKRTKRLLLGWISHNQNPLIEDVLKEGVEFIDGETLNHQSVHVFRRHFIATYGLDPETVLKFRRPFLGLYIRDLDNEIKAANVKEQLLPEAFSQHHVPLGLPGELVGEDPQADFSKEVVETISGETTYLEDMKNLVPLPRPGTDMHQAIRGLLRCQRECRLAEGSNMMLSYTFHNASQSCSCAISSFDGRFSALGLDDSGILLWDLVSSESANALKDLTPVLGESIAARSVAKASGSSFSRVNQSIKISSNSHEGIDNQSLSNSETLLFGHNGSVQSLCFGECGQVLLSGGVDGMVRLWTLGSSRSTRAVYRGGCYAVVSLDYGPFGYYFASCEADGAARLWATDRSFPLRILRTVQADALSVAFHPNSSLICTPCSDGKLRIWDLRASCCEIVLNCNSSEVGVNPYCGTVVSFAKNGWNLASANGPIINVFDLGQRKRMQMLLGHDDPILSLDFNYGSTILASADPHVLSLWNLKSKLFSTFCCFRSALSDSEDEPKTMKEGATLENSKKPELEGPIRLNSAFKILESRLRRLAYTPENVLLTVSLSTLAGVDTN